MNFETVELEYHNDGAVALIRLNRPDSLNAFNTQLIKDLYTATDSVRYDQNVRVVVLTGAGRAFSAGADLTDTTGKWRDTEEALMRGYWPSLRNIVQMEKLVICAVNGPAAGAGSGFAMAGDLAVMGEKAYIMLAFSNIALVPDCGANWFLARSMGYRRALQAAIEAEKIDAATCLENGLANKVVPTEEVVTEALKWAEELAARPARAMALTKELMRDSAVKTLPDLFGDEAVRQVALIGSADNKEGVTAFLEKRVPQFNQG